MWTWFIQWLFAWEYKIIDIYLYINMSKFFDNLNQRVTNTIYWLFQVHKCKWPSNFSTRLQDKKQAKKVPKWKNTISELHYDVIKINDDSRSNYLAKVCVQLMPASAQSVSSVLGHCTAGALGIWKQGCIALYGIWFCTPFGVYYW